MLSYACACVQVCGPLPSTHFLWTAPRARRETAENHSLPSLYMKRWQVCSQGTANLSVTWTLLGRVSMCSPAVRTPTPTTLEGQPRPQSWRLSALGYLQVHEFNILVHHLAWAAGAVLQSPIHTVPLSFTNWNNSLCLRGTNAFHSWSLQNCKAKVCLCELLMAKNKLFFSFWAMADMRDFILTHRTKVMSLLVTSSHQCCCHTYCIKGTSVLQQNIAYVNIWPPSHGRRSEQSLNQHLLCN